jgi:uncharacterized protein (TIGR03437 family)
MRPALALVFCAFSVLPACGATFGTVAAAPGGATYSDILLDEARQKIYLADSSGNRIDVYSTQQRAFLASIKTDTQPVSLAMSGDGKTLYVTAYTSSSLNIIDLTKPTLAVTARISLPAGPEGVAVGGDGRVLISTVGNAGQNVLLVYDPAAPSSSNLSNVALAPPAPTPPTLPAPSGDTFASYHSKLLATTDGASIIGSNVISGGATNNRVVFVYEVASGTVLRSRIVTNLSNVLSVSHDGTKFMAGSSLFDIQTLSIMAQENVANSPFAFPSGANFNTQTNQGGSVFSPDGTTLYSAFNFAPVQNPPANANVTRLLVNDPDNLLIKLGLQLPENLSGRMVMNAAGTVIYAISQSGLITLPIGTLAQSPVAQTDTQTILLANDQCGVTSKTNSLADSIKNAGAGRLSVNIQSYTIPTTGVNGLGNGNNGAGGIIIFLGGVGIVGGGGLIGVGGPGQTTNNTTTVPIVQETPGQNGATLNFKYNSRAATKLGTVGPSDFLVQSPEAVNIVPNIRVYQNNRDADARGTIVPVQQNISPGESLMDILQDTARQKLYITNSGMNQVEVFDMKTQAFTAPIKVGQLPHAMAFGNDGATMYVANTGGESISIVDLNKGQTVGHAVFPAIPTNVAVGLTFPVTIAPSERGPQFVMSDGSLWKLDGAQAIPRVLNPAIFGGSNTTTVKTVSGGSTANNSRTMASTPGGEYVLLATGAGFVYLYDASVDDYTFARQIFPTLTGFLGPVTAGPKGQYFVVNGTLLNSALTPLDLAGTSTGSVGGGTLPGQNTTTPRPTWAVAAIGANTFARFTQPVSIGNNVAATDAGQIEIDDAGTGNATRTINTLEGQASTITGTRASPISGRTLTVDSAGTTAYALTQSGLSVIPLTPVSPASRPQVSQGGVINLGSYQTGVAPGSLIGIFGQNLANTAANSANSLPTVLGGTCVTLNNQPLPLVATSTGQINAQLPTTLAAGKYPLVVRSIANQAASLIPQTVTVAKYAPAIFVSSDGQAAIYHADDGKAVTKDDPTTRDQSLTIYATGLGVTHGGTVTTGNVAPASPLAVTDPVQVFFGPQGYSQAPVIVNWSGLVPGLVGVNQINVTVPGVHMKGDTLPVTIKIGGVSSTTTGPAAPTVAVQ